MSKTSKARRDAKKKKRINPARREGLRTREPALVAHLIVDDQPFAAIGLDGHEWVLILRNVVVAGASDPGSIWGIAQSLAAKAELNGNFVSLRSITEFRSLMDANQLESINDNFDALADKILTIYPFPSPSLEQQSGTP